MSEATQVLNNGSQAITNYDVSKIFIGKNRYQTVTYTNDGYDDVTLVAGTLMGRVHATGEVKPLESDATDGSQYPVGVLHESVDVAAGDSVDFSICVAGDVVSSKIVLEKDGDTLDTVISDRYLRDRVASDTEGVHLVDSTEMTEFDNQ